MNKCIACGELTDNLYFCSNCQISAHELCRDAINEVKDLFEDITDSDALELLNEGFDRLWMEIEGEAR